MSDDENNFYASPLLINKVRDENRDIIISPCGRMTAYYNVKGEVVFAKSETNPVTSREFKEFMRKYLRIEWRKSIFE